MSLEFAILGFLNYHPYSGYDLKKIFDTSIRHFWPADQSQIYRTLARLSEQGLAEMEKIPQEDRPDRKVYHITDSGRATLLKWLAGPPPMDEPRSAPLIQVFFAGQLPDAEILAKFEGFAAMMRLMLSQYEAVPGQIGPFQQEIPSPREHFFWLLTLESGIRNMRANLEWAESIIERIKNGQVPPA
jgi:PadR family transcriptional regulator, regulatory protein AphA